MRVILMLLISLPCFAEEKGSITGKVASPEKVTAITAYHRAEKLEKYPGTVDAKTGDFKIENLPAGKSYDLVVDYDKARLEGVSLAVKKSDYIDEEPPLTKADVTRLKDITTKLSKFEDEHEYLAVTGNVQHAVVLVNKLRVKPFYESKPGEIIWRMELWYYEREEADDPWVKEQETLFIVIYRERLQKSEYEKKSITLDPKLGGLKPTGKAPLVIEEKIPAPEEKPGIRIRNAPMLKE